MAYPDAPSTPASPVSENDDLGELPFRSGAETSRYVPLQRQTSISFADSGFSPDTTPSRPSRPSTAANTPRQSFSDTPRRLTFERDGRPGSLHRTSSSVSSSGRKSSSRSRKSKDQSSSSFSPFITFDFEPEYYERLRAERVARRQSSGSGRVSIDHFDPEGVEELRRRLSQASRSTPSRPSRSGSNTPAVLDINSSGQTEVIPISMDLEVARSRRASIETDDVSMSDRTSSLTAADTTKVAEKKSDSFNLEAALKDVIEQREARHIPSRSLGVLFKDLRVVGMAASPSSGSSYQPTLGSMLNPLEWVKGFSKARHPETREILSGFEGVVSPGEMLLVLGRPGAGCSTFLKTLANQTDEYVAVLGERHYDSLSPQEIRERFRGDVTYCPEDDIHFPTLTVRETLSFAAKTRAPNKTVRIGNETRTEYAEHLTDILTTIFGLRHAKNTPVGDANIRGVSGGEKKRVSIAEALATRCLLGCWDNSTRGLDASTALEFGRALRIATDLAGLTTIVSIYQAGEALYELFDKVCVIGEGKMYYFGRADAAREYFEGLGYVPKQRQTTADFLVAVTDPAGRTVNPEHPLPIPRTSDDFVRAFHASRVGRENRSEMMAYWHEFVGRRDLVQSYAASAQAEHSKCAPPRQAYTISLGRQLWAVTVRRWQILKGGWASTAVQIFAFVFQAIVMGTTYLHIPDTTASFFSRGGVMYFAILFGAISAMAEIPALYSQRPIVNRHQKAAMYHPFIEALALTIVDIPLTLVIQIIFSVIVYFLVGLQRTAQQFFIFYLLVLTMTLTMKAFYRALAAAFKRESGAQATAGLATLLLVLYTGYAIPKPSMVGGLRWLTWISPLRYGFEAILSNEFHTLDAPCAALVPQGPGYENVSLVNQVCTTVGSISGQVNVDGNRFLDLLYEYSYSNLWRNFGVVVAFGIFFIAMLLIFTERNTSSATETSIVLFNRSRRRRANASSEIELNEKNTLQRYYSEQARQDQKALSAIRSQAPMTDVFTWRNLRYTVPVDKGERLLLDSVSGFVAPGKLTALMGESGAGKTTLLNVLAGRYTSGHVTGELLVNGQPLPSDFQSQTGYCQQMDTHTAEQTVREALLFSAKLRQPQSVPLAEKEAYVETCLKMCGLEDHAEAIVGTLGVEHRKRTTIGVELAAKPKLLLFLDEPTSGLDSQSALAIMMFLRDLADHGQAILCTIHQPSSDLFQYFDRLLLLRKGGKTAYFGDLGENCKTLINYFEEHGARECGPTENPAEWMLDVIGAGATASSSVDWHEKWLQSSDAVQVQQQLDVLHSEGRKRPAIQASIQSDFATSWAFQLITLIGRGFTSYWRNPYYLLAKLVLNIVAGLLVGFTFFKANSSIQGTQDKLFAIFMATIVCIPVSNQLQVIFIETRRIYEVRERPSQMYSWTALVTSQLIVELPWNILGSILLFFSWYFTVGFENSRAGYTFLMLAFVFPVYYTTFGQAIAALSPNAEISSLLFSLLFSFVGTFDGVLQPFSQLGWWRWMYRISPFTYLIEGLMGQAVGRQLITCASKEFNTVEPPTGSTCFDYMEPFINNFGGYIDNPDDFTACRYCAARTADEFLGSSFNIFYSHRWRNVGIILGISAFNLFMLYFLTYCFRIRKGQIISFRRK